MKKGLIILMFAAFLGGVSISSVQAATMKIPSVPDIMAGSAGSISFEILFEDFDASTSLVNLDNYQLDFQITGASGLALSALANPFQVPNFVFTELPFFSSITNPGGNLDQLNMFISAEIGDSNPNPQDLALALVTLNYPALAPGNLTISAFSTSYVEDLPGTQELLNFNPASINVNVVPIPGSILLLGSGLVGLIGIARRKRS